MIYDKRPDLKIPWYISFLLEFQLPKYSHEGDLTLVYKTLFGKTYVLTEITPDEDPA